MSDNNNWPDDDRFLADNYNWPADDGFFSLFNPEFRTIHIPMDNVIEQSMNEPLRKNPVPDDIIDGLQVVKITQNYIDESCIICTENFSLDEDGISLPCNHLYHERCIKEWFKLQNTCPICRLKISDSDDSSNLSEDSDSDELPNLLEDEREESISDSDELPNLSEDEREELISDSHELPNLSMDEREEPISDSSNLSMDEREEEILDSSNFSDLDLSDLEFLKNCLNIIFSQHKREEESLDSEESSEDESETFNWRREIFSQIFSLFGRPINVLEQIINSPPRENPVSDDIIEGLPIVKITQNFVDEFCIFCTENFSLGEDVLSLPCSHMYHKRCIKEWFKRQDMCPICRLKISDSDEPSNSSEDECEEPIIDSEDNLPDLEYEVMSNLPVTHPLHISILESSHEHCVKEWFKRQYTCPNCRLRISDDPLNLSQDEREEENSDSDEVNDSSEAEHERFNDSEDNLSDMDYEDMSNLRDLFSYYTPYLNSPPDYFNTPMVYFTHDSYAIEDPMEMSDLESFEDGIFDWIFSE